jgi:hypothetical protein
MRRAIFWLAAGIPVLMVILVVLAARDAAQMARWDHVQSGMSSLARTIDIYCMTGFRICARDSSRPRRRVHERENNEQDAGPSGATNRGTVPSFHRCPSGLGSVESLRLII